MTVAVIPCGGRGTRLAHFTRGTSKELLPIAGKPLLQWTLEEAGSAGLQQAIVVTSDTKPDIAAFLSDLPATPARPSIAVVVQPAPRGLGDAILCARPQAKGAPVALLLPDNVFRRPAAAPAIALVLDAHRRTGHSAVLLTEIARDAAGAVGATGRVRFRRRPDGLCDVLAVADKGPRGARFDTGTSPSAVTAIGRAVFTADVFRRLQRLGAEVPAGAELDDVPLLQDLAREGALAGVLLDGQFFDAGLPEGYAAALAALT